MRRRVGPFFGQPEVLTAAETEFVGSKASSAVCLSEDETMRRNLADVSRDWISTPHTFPALFFFHTFRGSTFSIKMPFHP